jgi:hypothetical protein
MPWPEVVTVELRQQFVHDALRRVVPVTGLCAAYGISRKTGYNFLARYRALGAPGLADQSRRPHRSPTTLDPVLLQRLLEAHDRHPYWGPASCSASWGSTGRRPLAGAIDRRAVFSASGAGHRAPARASPRPRGPAHRADGGAEGGGDHRLQGPIQTGRWPVLLAPHRRGRLHSPAALLSGAHQHPAGRGAAGLRAALPGARASPAHSVR